MRETFVKRENSQREVREESVYGWEQLMFALYLLHLKAVVSKYLHEISDEQCHNQAIVCEIGHFRIARILFTTLFPESTFIIQQPSHAEIPSAVTGPRLEEHQDQPQAASVHRPGPAAAK